jgi:mRNA interferase MazF
MNKGDIVLLPFPFTDLSGIKNRPALILVDCESDITVSFITTQLKWHTEQRQKKTGKVNCLTDSRLH